MIKKAVALTLVALGMARSVAVADTTLVTGGTIVKIINARNPNDGTFVILTEGGSGPCSSSTWIGFPPAISGVTDLEMQKKAYAIALFAMATGMKVKVISNDTSCWTGYWIEVSP